MPVPCRTAPPRRSHPRRPPHRPAPRAHRRGARAPRRRPPDAPRGRRRADGDRGGSCRHRLRRTRRARRGRAPKHRRSAPRAARACRRASPRSPRVRRGCRPDRRAPARTPLVPEGWSRHGRRSRHRARRRPVWGAGSVSSGATPRSRWRSGCRTPPTVRRTIADAPLRPVVRVPRRAPFCPHDSPRRSAASRRARYRLAPPANARCWSHRARARDARAGRRARPAAGRPSRARQDRWLRRRSGVPPARRCRRSRSAVRVPARAGAGRARARPPRRAGPGRRRRSRTACTTPRRSG